MRNASGVQGKFRTNALEIDFRQFEHGIPDDAGYVYDDDQGEGFVADDEALELLRDASA